MRQRAKNFAWPTPSHFPVDIHAAYGYFLAVICFSFRHNR